MQSNEDTMNTFAFSDFCMNYEVTDVHFVNACPLFVSVAHLGL